VDWDNTSPPTSFPRRCKSERLLTPSSRPDFCYPTAQPFYFPLPLLRPKFTTDFTFLLTNALATWRPLFFFFLAIIRMTCLYSSDLFRSSFFPSNLVFFGVTNSLHLLAPFPSLAIAPRSYDGIPSHYPLSTSFLFSTFGPSLPRFLLSEQMHPNLPLPRTSTPFTVYISFL